MLALTGSVHDAGFNRAMADIRRHLGLEGMREQAGLLVLELIRKTPPRAVREVKLSAIQAARRAIRNDLKNAVDVIDWKDFKHPDIRDEIRDAVSDKDDFAAETILRRVRRDFAWEVVQRFDPKLHRAVRDSSGRVRRNYKRATMDLDEWNRYLRKLWSRIGQLKATWVPAAFSAGVLNRVPAFVRRQRHSWGRALNRLSHSISPSFTAISEGYGINRHVRHAAGQALVVRAKAMVSRIKHELKKKAAQHGMTTR